MINVAKLLDKEKQIKSNNIKFNNKFNNNNNNINNSNNKINNKTNNSSNRMQKSSGFKKIN